MLRPTPRLQFRIVASAVLVCAFLTGCAAGGGAASQPSEFLGAQAESKNLLGTYLAGQHAGRINDYPAAAEFFLQLAYENPDNIESFAFALPLAAATGRLDDAVHIIDLLRDRKALDGNDSSLAALVLWTHAARRGDFGDAADAAALMPAGGPGVLFGPLMKAWADYGQGKSVEDAAQVLLPLRDQPGYDVVVKYHEALMQDLSDNTRAAADLYLGVLRSRTLPSSQVVAAYANFLARHGERKEAIGLLEGFLAAFPDNDLLRGQVNDLRQSSDVPDRIVHNAAEGFADALYVGALATGARQAGLHASIYGHLALALRPDFEEARLIVAETLQEGGRLQEAFDILEPLVNSPAVGVPVTLRRAGLLEELGQPDAARQTLRQLLHTHPAQAEALLQLARMEEGDENFAAAEILYSDIISGLGDLQENHWVVFYGRGISRERQGKWDLAEKDFFTALELSPKQPAVLNYLGYSWVEQGRNVEEALDHIKEAVDQRPDDGYIVDSLGWAYYRLAQYDKAVTWLEKAVDLRPEDPTINDHLGDAYWYAGRKLEARFQWFHAMSLATNSKDVARIRVKLVDRGGQDLLRP